MAPDVFTVVAEPQRRRILERLRAGHASVGELVDQLALPQPTVSKHLRVLRQAGFVTCRTAAQQRDRKSTRQNSSHMAISRMPSSA